MWIEGLNTAMISQSVAGVSLAISTVVALLNCFFGYKFRKLWVTLAGFGCGLLAGFMLAVQMTEQTGVLALVTILCGLAVAFVAFRLYRFGLFLLCGYRTFLVVSAWVSLPWLAVTLGLVAGVLVGALALKFLRPVVIASTAIGGGATAAQGLLVLFSIATDATWTLVASLGLGAMGVVFQLLTTKK